MNPRIFSLGAILFVISSASALGIIGATDAPQASYEYLILEEALWHAHQLYPGAVSADVRSISSITDRDLEENIVVFVVDWNVFLSIPEGSEAAEYADELERFIGPYLPTLRMEAEEIMGVGIEEALRITCITTPMDFPGPRVTFGRMEGQRIPSDYADHCVADRIVRYDCSDGLVVRTQDVCEHGCSQARCRPLIDELMIIGATDSDEESYDYMVLEQVILFANAWHGDIVDMRIRTTSELNAAVYEHAIVIIVDDGRALIIVPEHSEAAAYVRFLQPLIEPYVPVLQARAEEIVRYGLEELLSLGCYTTQSSVYEAGVTSGVTRANPVPSLYLDSCVGDVLTYYGCSGWFVSSQTAVCPHGCTNGACNRPPHTPVTPEDPASPLDDQDSGEDTSQGKDDPDDTDEAPHEDDSDDRSEEDPESKASEDTEHTDDAEDERRRRGSGTHCDTYWHWTRNGFICFREDTPVDDVVIEEPEECFGCVSGERCMIFGDRLPTFRTCTASGFVCLSCTHGNACIPSGGTTADGRVCIAGELIDTSSPKIAPPPEPEPEPAPEPEPEREREPIEELFVPEQTERRGLFAIIADFFRNLFSRD
ncbi:MAG: hypothetical protein ACMXYM_03185 [Candidatus Woesearchaeota archaeon]